MWHMEVYKEQSHLGVVSQCGDHHMDVHEKCVEHGASIPGDLQKLHEIAEVWETFDEW